jgi:hypothetical protein
MAFSIQESPVVTSTIHTNSVLTTAIARDRLNTTIKRVIQEIVIDSKSRLDSGNLVPLSSGIFYPPDYFTALKVKQQTARLDYLLSRDSFYNGYLNPKYFTLIENVHSSSGKQPLSFVLKEDVDPVEALQSVLKGLSLIGCGEVCQLAQYAAILDIIGAEKFRVLFSASSATPLMLGSSLKDNPIGRFRTYIMKEDPKPTMIKKGDVVYFANVAAYVTKHLWGPAQGYNTICVDDSIEPRFTTLGLPSEGVTPRQMQAILIQDYNSPCTYLECLSQRTKTAFLDRMGPAAVSLSKQLKDSQISVESFEKQQGGKLTLVCELDAAKITSLANSTLKESRILLDSFRAKRADRLC